MPANPITIGLISDTHIPARWDELPEAVFDYFDGVDLIIHAGDVGELYVLDQLSRIAPVVAVHGNDEGEQAKQVLPFQHTFVATGHRIVVTHGHIPDYKEEMEQRKDDNWHPKLTRLVEFGKRSSAGIVISGHSHIAMALQYKDVWLVNPGAVASGGASFRQVVQTVARMRLEPDMPPVVEHFELNTQKPFFPQVDVNRGFAAAAKPLSEPILEPELMGEFEWIRDEVFTLVPEELLAAFIPLLRPRWRGGAAPVTVQEFMTAIKNNGVSQTMRDKLSESDVFSRYL
jgi:putative phosphoesterase